VARRARLTKEEGGKEDAGCEKLDPEVAVTTWLPQLDGDGFGECAWQGKDDPGNRERFDNDVSALKYR
jgi:hypothetical protein